MKKSIKKSLVIAAIIFAGLSVNVASAQEVNAPACKIAVVNVAAVLESSSEVMALRKEQQLKLDELKAWLTKAKADVDKQSTKEGKEKLIKKYDDEFAKRQVQVRDSYAKKLQAIDKHISAVIEQERQAKGYDIVIVKGTVLSGGIDITKDIAKKVK